jgi:hypothetical protein
MFYSRFGTVAPINTMYPVQRWRLRYIVEVVPDSKANVCWYTEAEKCMQVCSFGKGKKNLSEIRWLTSVQIIKCIILPRYFLAFDTETEIGKGFF